MKEQNEIEIERSALTADVARKYRVTPRTVQLWVQRKWVPSLKIGNKIRRFNLDEVARALAERFGK